MHDRGAANGSVRGMATSDPRSEAAAAAERPGSAGGGWLASCALPDSLPRRLLLALLVYGVTTAVFAMFAGTQRLTAHTPFNHFALLADAWLHGRQDIAGGPPGYAMNNDFAEFHGKTYISFPPLPAMLMLPFVKLAGSADNFRDGQFAVELAGIAPAALFLVLEKLRRTGRSTRTEPQNLVLAFLYAFGTVYFFTAVEGTVWFVAMVVGAAEAAFYTLWALDAERPMLAGAMLGAAYLTRPFILLTAPLFALEALRVSAVGGLPTDSRRVDRIRTLFSRVDPIALARRYALFAAPILVAFGIAAWMNWSRYDRATPFWFDHEFLTVGWHARIMKWGLLGYHYFAKNLGIMLSSLPWLPARGAGLPAAPFQINEHGLALWFTTPLYFWLLWPRGFGTDRDRTWLYAVVALSAALPATIDLFYQNSGWRTFGYRFSNDYSILLFVLLAIGARPMRILFAMAAAWSIAWNAFGAATFDKAALDRFYFRDGSQTIVYQPD
jgi:hypothetical protein